MRKRNNPSEPQYGLVRDDQTAYDELFRATMPDLLRRAERLCAGDYALAQDRVQQAYLVAATDDGWAVLRRLKPGQQKRWMITTMTNKILDGHRARARARDYPLAPEMLPEGTYDRAIVSADIVTDAIHTVESQQLYLRARQALADTLLPDHEMPYTVLLLDLADYTTSEIATTLEIKQGTVRSHRSRGISIMKRDCPAFWMELSQPEREKRSP